MIVDQAIALIQNDFTQSCIELFETMQCTIVPSNLNAAQTTYIPAAYIDAGAKDFELLLTLRLPLAALTMTYPVQEHSFSVDEKELEDWSLEISNRLLGVLKAKLTSRDCQLNTGLPSHDFGEDNTQSINQCDYIPFYFMLDDEPIELGITLECFNENIDISETSKASDSNVQAGDIDFFF